MTELNKILSERGDRYGRFADVAKTTKRIEWAIQWAMHGKSMRDYQEVALQMIASKLARTEGLTVPEIDQKLDVGKVSTVISILTKRVKAGEVKVVGSRPSEKTGRMINVYGINPDYAKKRRSAKAARTSKVSKELSKHFREFKPTYGPVMGVWV